MKYYNCQCNLTGGCEQCKDSFIGILEHGEADRMKEDLKLFRKRFNDDLARRNKILFPMKNTNSKKRNPALKDFRLIPETAGAILDGIYVKNDNSELKIKIAWKEGFLCFRPLKDGEVSL